MATTEHIQLKGAVEGRASEVLTKEALGFVARLQREFGGRRQELLRLRDERQTRIEAGGMPPPLVTTSSGRDSDWGVGKAPQDLQGPRGEDNQRAAPPPGTVEHDTGGTGVPDAL